MPRALRSTVSWTTAVARRAIARRRASGRAASTATTREAQRVLVLTGPTGVGKSSVAIEIASRATRGRFEIVSCDSVQIYKGLDVGSGKVTREQRGRATHHMLDERDARVESEEYDAAAYYDDCVRTLREIRDRGNVAIVVGGAGMYLKWLTDGKPTAPASTSETRERAAREIGEARERGGWRAACDALVGLGDEDTARGLSENDWYRLTRAYEILLASGRTVSSYDRASPDERFDFRCFFLSAPRVELYRKIDERVENMILNGIMDEAAWLLDAGIAPGGNVAARAIGYRQAMEYLAKARAKDIDVSADTLLELLKEIQGLNRAYAKRQFTWFRGESKYLWIDASSSCEDIARRVLTEFECDEHHAGGEQMADVSKEELEVLKRYRPHLSVLSDASAMERVLDRIRALI
ncbi:tRNA isopentenyltransferase [Ostreococcus tauri]|uniref:tRNA dimethylallyltransferase n=1 Tax=Ostreococcus tauri TaxID=70448 RepID=A0A090M2Q5_OSTTA|nr:tRNA isopentenyltransferase [Ostreococcus tauri]CEF98535.1 tRNA isopentenyltransferase [Ostreococcus tauri]|eukprot:XP_022839316.1 tRNA isopentenyltransferase [Ostreococcus tauri]